MQFLGRVQQPELGRVWKILAEGKVKFFLWLLLQNRNWTAERRRARGLPHDDLYSLYDQEFETATHLALGCSFAKEVWACFQGTYPLAVQIANTASTVWEWWGKISRGKEDDQKKKRVTASAYVVWHVWKERGRRIFQDEVMTATAVASLIRADLELLFLANDRPRG